MPLAIDGLVPRGHAASRSSARRSTPPQPGAAADRARRRAAVNPTCCGWVYSRLLTALSVYARDLRSAGGRTGVLGQRDRMAVPR
jgi:hypothetical protein